MNLIRRRWALSLMLAGFALMTTVVAAPGNGCDMKTVESAFYCEKDSAVLGKRELVSKKAYYQCESCKEISAKSGKCKACDKKRTKLVSGDGVCPKCFGKVIAVEACMKTGFVCPKCGSTTAKASKCEECKTARKKSPVPAVIVYTCPECRKTSYTAGTCQGAECAKKGQALVKTCSKSGTPPHATESEEPKKEDGNKKDRKKK